MKVAVIGGGASGVVTAHLLDEAHHVTLIEREAVLGGNIRTLNRNVSCSEIPADLHLDAGVIEFEIDRFPAFHALMNELGVELGRVRCTTALYLADGRSFLSPGGVRLSTSNRIDRERALVRLLPLAWSRRRFLQRTARATNDELIARPLSDFLDTSVFSTWLQLLCMYAYSIPAPAVPAAPAALTVPMLRNFLRSGRWSRVVGGVYTYVERVLDRFSGEILLAAEVREVRRGRREVVLEMSDGTLLNFDAVVFATTPDQVGALLADPSDAELRRFGSWRPRPATTVVHNDDGLYRRRGITYPTEFDLVETTTGSYGYNAYLNRLSGLARTSPVHYQLAFNLDDEIDPNRVLHVQHHTTPDFTVEAFRYRDEVVETNGENRTFHAGAYLGDGLHEGAVRSANAVSRLLGGREIQY